jgi:hypothetical protein
LFGRKPNSRTRESSRVYIRCGQKLRKSKEGMVMSGLTGFLCQLKRDEQDDNSDEIANWLLSSGYIPDVVYAMRRFPRCTSAQKAALEIIDSTIGKWSESLWRKCWWDGLLPCLANIMRRGHGPHHRMVALRCLSLLLQRCPTSPSEFVTMHDGLNHILGSNCRSPHVVTSLAVLCQNEETKEIMRKHSSRIKCKILELNNDNEEVANFEADCKVVLESLDDFGAEMADLLLRKEEEDRIQAMEHDDEQAAKDHDTVRAMWLGYLDRGEREEEDKFDEEEERELLSFLNKNRQE